MKKITIAITIMCALILGLTVVAHTGTSIEFDTPQAQPTIVSGDLMVLSIRPNAIKTNINLIYSDGSTKTKKCNFAPDDGYYDSLIATTISGGMVDKPMMEVIEQGVLNKCKTKYGWSGTITSN
jgi:hypothetical protein